MADRVIQWATGAMGRSVSCAIVDHPGMGLVGPLVYDEDKAGCDAGSIMWRPSTGVIATRDPENILAMDADVVIHCSRLAPPYGSHDDDIIRLLASGKNVISINGYNNSRHWTGARREALEAACRAGCGLESGLCRRAYRRRRDRRPQSLDHIEVVKIADNRAIRSSAYAFNILGLSDAQHSP